MVRAISTIAICVFCCGLLKSQSEEKIIIKYHALYIEAFGASRYYSVNYSGQLFHTDYSEIRANAGVAIRRDNFSYSVGVDLFLGGNEWNVKPVMGYSFAHDVNIRAFQGDTICSECPAYFYQHSVNIGLQFDIGKRWALTPKYYPSFLLVEGAEWRFVNWFGLQLRYYLN